MDINNFSNIYPRFIKLSQNSTLGEPVKTKKKKKKIAASREDDHDEEDEEDEEEQDNARVLARKKVNHQSINHYNNQQIITYKLINNVINNTSPTLCLFKVDKLDNESYIQLYGFNN